MTMGPGGGGDPGNAGRGGGRNGATGGGGRGNNTPGAPDGNGRGRTGSPGSDGRGNNTPGHPGNPGRRGNSSPDGRGNNTPGSPQNPGRRGMNAIGSTPSSRARDAMSRHQRERDVRSINSGGLVIGDNDENAGLGLTHAMDSQQTENALNRSGVTDTLGMGEVDRIGMARKAGAMLSSTDRQRERGIRHGFDSQFAADRVSDITGLPSIATDAAVGLLSRPSNTMANDVAIGRERAKDKNIGALAEAGLSLGFGVPGNVANFGGAIVGSATDSNMSALASPKAPGAAGPTAGQGSGTAAANRASASRTSARTAMTNGMRRPATHNFEWAPVDLDSYGKGLISLAMQ